MIDSGSPWSEVFGSSDRVHVLEACIDMELRSFDTGDIADMTPVSAGEADKHLKILANKGVVTTKHTGTDGEYKLNKKNSLALALLQVDRKLLSQYALQSDFDTALEHLENEN